YGTEKNETVFYPVECIARYLRQRGWFFEEE
ncbi:MAG: hypothetical protein ACI9LN_002046, partial [Saprospiraceae bacterium]